MNSPHHPQTNTRTDRKPATNPPPPRDIANTRSSIQGTPVRRRHRSVDGWVRRTRPGSWEVSKMSIYRPLQTNW